MKAAVFRLRAPKCVHRELIFVNKTEQRCHDHEFQIRTRKMDEKSTCRAYWQWKLNTLISLRNAKRIKDETNKRARGNKLENTNVLTSITLTNKQRNRKENFRILELGNKTLRSVHFGVVVIELINCKCGGIVRNEIW